MQANVYFVILHYQTINETTECVESIINNIKYKNKHIIIVDNASPNKSGLYLKDYYKNYENIEVIINSKNLGFAKGNNVGYAHAKEMGAEYIVQVNSDTIFKDEFFITELIKIHKEKGYAVLGPKIISLEDGGLQNPLKNGVKSVRDIKRKIIELKIKLLLSYLNLDKLIINFLKKNNNNNSSIMDKEYIDITEDIDVLLHGCCFIFSSDYINEFEGMFDKTFMYYEEHILYYNCNKKGLKMLYTNKIQLFHKRKASTKEVYAKEINRRRFTYKESIKSLVAFKNYLKQ